MNIRLSATAVAVASLFPFSISGAIAKDADEPQLGTLVVTATRIPTRISDVLSDVTVVERDEIERVGGATLPELLANLPGVQITTNGGPGSSGTVSIHGSNSNHVLVLVDGLRVSSATLGTTAIEHIPLDQIERIEVLRGAASSLYGSDAVGGVIQIFTRSGAGVAAPSLSFGMGRYGTVNASAGYGARSETTKYNVVVAGEHSDGYGSIRKANGGFVDPFNPDRDPYDNWSISASVSHKLSSDLEVGANLMHIEADKHFDAANCDAFFTLCTGEFDSHMRARLQSVGGNVKYRVLPTWTTSLRVAQSQDRSFNWIFDPVTTAVSRERFDTRQDQAAWENELDLLGGKFLGSAEWRKEKVFATQDFVHDDRTTESLVLGYQRWFGNHSVQASGRVDDISRSGTHRTGAFAYGFRFADGWLARASVATAFHAPTFNDLFWPLDQVNFFRGNPDLKPERARNREVGISYDKGNVSAGLTLYHNRVTDLIDFAPGSAPTFIGTMENVSSVTLKGATFHYELHNGPWNWKFAYDALNAKNDDTGKLLQRRAPRTGSLEVRRDFSGYDVGVQVTSTGTRYNNPSNTQTLGGYTLVNLDTNVQLNKEWSLQGRINNLFDRDYVLVRTTFAPTSEYVTPGRFLFVGVRYAPK
jgi:vitamin B12 transporter